MIKEFRSYARGIGSKLLMALLIVVFGIWGIGDMMNKSGGHVNVATVGDLHVTANELGRSLSEETDKLRGMFGSKVTPEILAGLNIAPKVLQKLVDVKLLIMESRKSGIRLSDEEVANSIRKRPEFADDKGKFNKDVFNNFLKRTGQSEKNYIQKLRDDVGVKILLETLSSGITVPPNAAEVLYKSRGEKRVVELYTITNSQVKNFPAPTEEQLKDYYESRAGDFAAPEYRTLSYLTVSADDAKKNVNAHEANKANIENIYRERIEEFKRSERRKVDQLLFGNEEAANKAYGAIKGGKSFEAVGKESNILNPKSLSLGAVEKSALMSEAADKVFALEKGSVSEPIKTSFGWHIFKVNDIIAVSTLSLEEARPQLEKELEQQANENALNDLSNKLEDSIAGGSSLAEAAKEFNLKLETLPPVDKSGKLADGTAAKGLPEDAKFLDVAFKTDERSESGMINSKGGKSYILRVEKIDHEHKLAYDDVKDKIKTAWTQSERKKVLKVIAEKISEGFSKDGERVNTIKNYSLSAPTMLTVTHKRDDASKLPAQVIGAIFTAKVGDSSPEFEQANGEYGVVVLKSITTPAADDKDAAYADELEIINRDYRNTVQNELLEQYLRFLATKYKISVNTAAVQALAKSEQ